MVWLACLSGAPKHFRAFEVLAVRAQGMDFISVLDVGDGSDLGQAGLLLVTAFLGIPGDAKPLMQMSTPNMELRYGAVMANC